jgi:hypothetical protein
LLFLSDVFLFFFFCFCFEQVLETLEYLTHKRTVIFVKRVFGVGASFVEFFYFLLPFLVPFVRLRSDEVLYQCRFFCIQF